MILFALFFSAWVHQLRREPELVREIAREGLRIAQRYGYVMAGAWLSALDGRAEAQLGEAHAGVDRLRRALDELREIGAELMPPAFSPCSQSRFPPPAVQSKHWRPWPRRAH